MPTSSAGLRGLKCQDALVDPVSGPVDTGQRGRLSSRDSLSVDSVSHQRNTDTIEPKGELTQAEAL